jgi:Ca-activated chloride channel family protein
MGTALLTKNRAILFLLSAVAASCHRGGSGSTGSGGGPIRAIDVDVPIGLEGQAVSRCDRDGKKCDALAKDDTLADGTMVKSARGARASIELGPSASLDVGEDSMVVLESSNSIEVQRGSVVVRKLGSPSDKSDAFRIDVAGRVGEVDPKVGGNVVVRARSADRAAVTVEKGKLTLRSSGGQTTVLLSGETVDLVKGKPPERIASFLAVETRSHAVAQPPLVAQAEPRGLGRMTARVPGRTDVVSGVRLTSHNVNVVLRDGLARTEVEEVFQNDTAQVLEGRYVFPLPADASISSLALWVNDKPVEGEIVEKKRAAAIFKGIVEDTVRPRDPALLEWVAGGDFSLKIFPLPPKGNRKVRIAYDQVLKESGGRVRYVYPLSVGAERATQIDDFTVRVRATDTRSRLDEVETPRYATSKNGDERGFDVSFGVKQFTPSNDFIVSYARQTDSDAEVSAYVPSWGEFKGGGLDGAARGADGTGYFALRLRADLPGGMSPAHVRRDRAIVVDTSHSQSKETLEGEAKLASGLVRQLDSDERFVVLACDSACITFPESGLAASSEDKLAELDKWFAQRAPTGSSDVAGALLDAARRLESDGSAQVVYIGDGSPTSGELSAAAVAARVRSTMRDRRADLRFLGAGRAVDEVVVGALAQNLGATYEPVSTGESMESRIADLAMALRSPVIHGAQMELPSSFTDVYPRTLPNLRLGEQVVVVGRLAANEPGEVKLRGDLDGQPYALTRAVKWTAEASRQNPLVPRLWSLARLSDLEAASDAGAVKQAIDLSKQYHVMSRYTSLLVLENDQMFAEFGIKRTAAPTAGLPTDDLALASGGGSGRAFAPGAVAANPFDARDDLPAKPAEEKAKGSTGSSGADKEPQMEAERRAMPAPTAAPAAAAPPPAPAARPAAKKSDDLSSVASEGASVAAQPAPMPSVAADAKSEAPRTVGQGAGGFGVNAFGVGDGLGRLGGVGLISGNVTLATPQVSSGLPREVVARIVRQNTARLRMCYAQGLRSNPSLSGRVVVRFVIRQDGVVATAADGGSSLPDSGVVACAVAMMQRLSFPSPETGLVMVSQPMNFSPGEPRPMFQERWFNPEPTASHRAADDSWLGKGEDALSKLRTALEQNPNSRKKYEDLARGLLARGRFEEALGTAKKFVSIDPDSTVARELLAYAAVANDDAQLAASAVDTQVETDPSSVKWHVRGARAFEALGDERRACAHWRSLAGLDAKSDEFAFEALRCRARVMDDRDAVLSEMRSMPKPGKLVADLVGQVEGGRPPPFSKAVAGAGQFEAEVTCSFGERCPTVFVVSPIGSVFSPFTPTDSRSSGKSVAFSGLRDGTYMTLLAGGSPDARGEVHLRALGSTKTFPISHGGRQTVAATRVTIPDVTRWPVTAFEGFLAR